MTIKLTAGPKLSSRGLYETNNAAAVFSLVNSMKVVVG